MKTDSNIVSDQYFPDQYLAGEHLPGQHLPNQHLIDWQDRLQDAIDGTLTVTELAQVNAHLANCALCTVAQQRLLAVDTQLRDKFTNAITLSTNFEQRLFTSIAALEQDKRTLAQQREQQEYAARLAQVRNAWREFVRFHLGNIIGGVVILSTMTTAIISIWPTITKGWSRVQDIVLPHAWQSAMPTAAVLATVGIAIATLWIGQQMDRRIG